MSNQSLLAPDERVLSTLEKDGSRRWMYPRLARGRFLTRRRIVAYILLALYVLIPFLTVGGKPVMLLDVVHRRFTLLGVTFLPTDTALLALLLVSSILTIFFLTALLGRVWCGWACPQTVYMEFVFRPIERLFTGRAGRGGTPPEDVAGWRKALMYAAFFIICLHLANTFLAYFVPAATLHAWITSSPAQHPAGFAIVAIVTGLMLFDFCFFREQTCIIACPYGRLQSVLLDKWSMIISYDTRRGEPRGRRKGDRREGDKEKEFPVASCELPVASCQSGLAAQSAISGPGTQDSALSPSGVRTQDSRPSSGDCVACELCVAVCPTGIDIREGLQVECIGCAQCIDACDGVMDKIKRPRGLIRYSSQSTMAGERGRILRPRVVIYSAIVVAIVGLLTYLLATRSSTDVTVLRNIGRPFVVSRDGAVENTMRVIVTNRSDREMSYRFSLVDAPGVAIEPAHESVTVGAGQSATEPLHIRAAAKRFVAEAGSFDVKIRISASDGSNFDRVAPLLGPMSWTPDSANGGAHEPR